VSGGTTFISHFIQIFWQASRDETVTLSQCTHAYAHTHSGDLICHVFRRKEVGSELFDNDDGNVDGGGGGGGNETGVQARLFIALISM